MQWKGKDRKEVEHLLLAALNEAKLAYQEARLRVVEADDLASATDANSSDGALQYGIVARRATELNRAVTRYRQTLAWFTEFTISGKLPEEDDGSA